MSPPETTPVAETPESTLPWNSRNPAHPRYRSRGQVIAARMLTETRKGPRIIRRMPRATENQITSKARKQREHDLKDRATRLRREAFLAMNAADEMQRKYERAVTKNERDGTPIPPHLKSVDVEPFLARYREAVALSKAIHGS